jgi:hypothetical protein
MRAVCAAACLLLAALAATPPPSPSPGPSPAASASPSPTPVATPTILLLGPDAAPQILWVNLSSTTPRAGESLKITVLTSSNVASVELRVGGYGAGMTKMDVGHFETTTQVPRLPAFMSHQLTLQVIARNTSGTAVQQSVPIAIR